MFDPKAFTDDFEDRMSELIDYCRQLESVSIPCNVVNFAFTAIHAMNSNLQRLFTNDNWIIALERCVEEFRNRFFCRWRDQISLFLWQETEPENTWRCVINSGASPTTPNRWILWYRTRSYIWCHIPIHTPTITNMTQLCSCLWF